MQQSIELAPSGSTGNNTHTSAHIGGYETVALTLEIEVAGATPTVTFKFQGSHDGTNWYDLAYITDASDTLATAALTKTAEAEYTVFPSNTVTRRYRYFRVVTSANTNVTYKATAYKYKKDD